MKLGGLIVCDLALACRLLLVLGMIMPFLTPQSLLIFLTRKAEWEASAGSVGNRLIFLFFYTKSLSILLLIADKTYSLMSFLYMVKRHVWSLIFSGQTVRKWLSIYTIVHWKLGETFFNVPHIFNINFTC